MIIDAEDDRSNKGLADGVLRDREHDTAVETGESSESIIHEEENDKVEKKTSASIPWLTGMRWEQRGHSGFRAFRPQHCGPRDFVQGMNDWVNRSGLNDKTRGVSVCLMNRKGYAQGESLPFGSIAIKMRW